MAFRSNAPGTFLNFAMFFPWILRMFPRLTGFDEQKEGLLVTKDLMETEFKKDIGTRIPGQPRNYKEAFLDERDRQMNNPASSFHPSRKLKFLLNFFNFGPKL